MYAESAAINGPPNYVLANSRPSLFALLGCEPLISGGLAGIEYCGETHDGQTLLSPLGPCGRNLATLTIRESKSYCPAVVHAPVS